MSSITEFRNKRAVKAATTSSSSDEIIDWKSRQSKLFIQRGFYFRLLNNEFGDEYKWSHTKSSDAFEILMSNKDDSVDIVEFRCKVYRKDDSSDEIVTKKIYSLFPADNFPSKELYLFRENVKWIYCPANFEGELRFNIVFDERGLKYLTQENVQRTI
jgi:hypothetical protein